MAQMALLLVEMISGRANVRHGARRLGFFGQTLDALDESTSPEEAASNGCLIESRHKVTSGLDRGRLWGPSTRENGVNGV